jgi:hypothetical protein
MILKIHTANRSTHKITAVLLGFLVVTHLMVAGAMAASCDGSADCLNCVMMTHPQAAAPDSGVASHGCASPKSGMSCDLEAAQPLVSHQFVLPGSGSVLPDVSWMVAATTPKADPARFPTAACPTGPIGSDIPGVPLYLQNLSLRC